MSELVASFSEEKQVFAETGDIVFGVAGTVEVGTVVEGNNAAVTNSGTKQNAVLNFVLPRGPEGPAPEKGKDYWTPEDKQEIISEVLEQVPSGSEIDDTTVSPEKTWSSRNIVEKLAPAFESSGPMVTCTPVEGYPLHVVSQIVPVCSILTFF